MRGQLFDLRQAKRFLSSHIIMSWPCGHFSFIFKHFLDNPGWMKDPSTTVPQPNMDQNDLKYGLPHGVLLRLFQKWCHAYNLVIRVGDNTFFNPTSSCHGFVAISLLFLDHFWIILAG